jgi:hypothetical protein
MPKKKALKASPLVQEAEETLLREDPIPLSLEERTALRTALTSGYFRKALHNARLAMPSPMLNQALLNSALGSVAANNRLHEIRGWKMFEAAIGKQVEHPLPPAPKAQENYPDAGRV